MERLFRGLRAVEESVILKILPWVFFAPTFFALFEVFFRFVFKKSFVWSNDVVVYAMLTSVFLHLGITERLGSHLRVTIITDLLVKRSRVIGGLVRVFGHLVAFVYISVFSFWAYNLVLFGKQVGRVTQSQLMPLWPFYAVMFVGFVWFGVWVFCRLFRDLQAMTGKHDFEDELLGDPNKAKDPLEEVVL